jgi:GYF domain 2
MANSDQQAEARQMPDMWWWAQFGQQHGPISLSELKEKLQGVNSHEIFVWRAGFHELREAGTVPELDIVKPPLPKQSPKPKIGVLKKPISDMELANERIAQGVVGFVLGFGLTVALEVMLLGGLDFGSGDEFLPRGLGWIAMPIAAGIGGWRAFQEIDFAQLGRSIAERALTETGIPQSKRTAALALIAAIGWVVGTLTGFFVTLAEGHHATLAKWLFGEWGYYFPSLGIGWGVAGVVFAFAIIYARQLLSNK